MEDDVAGAQPAAPSFVKPGVTVSRLVEVPVRDVWPTEYGHFTPWLLANSDAVSEAIGLDVQLEAREHPVGGYSLDLIGSDVQEPDRRVIVENQYGPTDHRHLGQLLTYAGGTEPTTVIWIAEQFRDEHRAALDWLNANVTTGVRFFGLRLSLVTLVGAPSTLVAPQLEVVVRPNDYVVEAKRSADGQQVGPTPKQLGYREFWRTLEPEVRARGWTTGSAPAKNWWNFPSGVSNAPWGVNFGSSGAPKAELYFGAADGATNTRRFHALREHAATIEAAVPGVVFDDLPARKACRVEVVMAGSTIDDAADWPAIRAWMLDTLTRLRAAVTATGGVPA